MTKKNLFLLAFFALSLIGQAQTAYRAKVYPQQQETCGTASISHDGNTYTLSNALFAATFRHEGDKLYFDGSEALGLLDGTELFTLRLGTESKVVNASEMTLVSVEDRKLTGSDTAVKGSHHFDGVELVATYNYTYKTSKITAVWRAELRDGSHYLKTDLTLSADKDTRFTSITPLQYEYNAAEFDAPVAGGNTRGSVFLNDHIFFGLETPMGVQSAKFHGEADGSEFSPTSWTESDFESFTGAVPEGITALGYTNDQIIEKQGYVTFAKAGEQTFTFVFNNGNLRLDIAGVDIVEPGTGKVLASDYHHGISGGSKIDNTYTLNVPEADTEYILRYFVETKSDGDPRRGQSAGNINISTTVTPCIHEVPPSLPLVSLQGLWERATNLTKDEPWNVSAIIGLIDASQKRRSILAYSERERAVPWRCFPHYNSWYELNINRKDHPNPADNMKVGETVEVVNQWKTNLFDKYGVSVKAFVWDDGWDQYGLWTPHASFPNGFMEPDAVARQMCSGIGCWLGPCGGYGESGTARNNYWTSRGGQHRLGYAPFYKVFKDACANMVNSYDFRYFKFDGISQQYPHPVGPSALEDCEGIIRVERYVRENLKEDIFFNTTVGTWASPFWFHFTDAVWRGADDWKQYSNSNSNNREAWITYRDDLVHDYFVKESPYCPINTMMTHGFILSKYGGSSDRTYKNALNELRCAFACGSGMIELYCDSELMSSINGGKLWGDLAECLKWQREQADVLPDIHWVGGDPWSGPTNDANGTGETAIYGWASWNGVKATLTLRNGGTGQKSITFTLREFLDIPADVKTTVTLTKAFASQAALTGITDGQAIDIDKSITLRLPANSVYVWNGTDGNATPVKVEKIQFAESSCTVGTGAAVAPQHVVLPIDASNRTLSWTSADESIATVKDGAIIGVKEGTTTVTATANDQSGVSATVSVTVVLNLNNELQALVREVQAAYDANETVGLGDNLITKNSQFSSNATETSEGSINNLLDGDASTFWHSTWKGVSGNTMDKHYLQVALSEPISGNVRCTQMYRAGASNDFVTRCRVQSSTDGETFADAAMLTFEGTPSAGATATGDFFLADTANHLRFWISETTSNRTYGHFGDFQLNLVVRDAANTTHPDAAQALLVALAEARSVKTATNADIDALQQAYEAYLAALNGGETGIGNLAKEEISKLANEGLFDLQGRKLSPKGGAGRGLRGLYILGGKKVLK